MKSIAIVSKVQARVREFDAVFTLPMQDFAKHVSHLMLQYGTNKERWSKESELRPLLSASYRWWQDRSQQVWVEANRVALKQTTKRAFVAAMAYHLNPLTVEYEEHCRKQELIFNSLGASRSEVVSFMELWFPTAQGAGVSKALTKEELFSLILGKGEYEGHGWSNEDAMWASIAFPVSLNMGELKNLMVEDNPLGQQVWERITTSQLLTPRREALLGIDGVVQSRDRNDPQWSAAVAHLSEGDRRGLANTDVRWVLGECLKQWNRAYHREAGRLNWLLTRNVRSVETDWESDQRSLEATNFHNHDSGEGFRAWEEGKDDAWDEHFAGQRQLQEQLDAIELADHYIVAALTEANKVFEDALGQLPWLNIQQEDGTWKRVTDRKESFALLQRGFDEWVESRDKANNEVHTTKALEANRELTTQWAKEAVRLKQEMERKQEALRSQFTL